MLTVLVMREAGYDEALAGLGLSYNTISDRWPIVAERLAFRGNGESKFLESIFVWLDVTGPRYWWQEADTYRISTKQSASTMHTIMRRPLVQDDFVEPIEESFLSALNDGIARKDFRWVKRHLPESFLQRRIWAMSYSTLQRIFRQRRNHRLPEWREFLSGVVGNIAHPEFVVPPEAGTE